MMLTAILVSIVRITFSLTLSLKNAKVVPNKLPCLMELHVQNALSLDSGIRIARVARSALLELTSMKPKIFALNALKELYTIQRHINA